MSAAPLRVAINGWFWGEETTGSGQYLSHLLHALRQAQPADHYTVCTPAGKPAVQPAAWMEGLSILPLATPFDGRSRHLAKVWFEQIAFPRACRRIEVDVAHVPYWGGPGRIGAPLVVTVHDLIPLLLPAYRGPAAARLYTWLVSRTLRRAERVLTDSHASATDLRARLGVAEERLRVVYLAADPRYQPAHAGRRLDAVRERYGLPAEFILYLGGFDQRKNVSGLIRAYAALCRRRPATPALVVAGRFPAGDSGFFPHPQRVAREANVAERVRFLGWTPEEDKPALYALATLFVFPSFYEGFGLPILEAMACGAPVIAGRGSSTGEIVGPAGVLVEPGSDEELAAAMGELLDDEAQRARLAAAGLARAAQFQWAETARLTRESYLEAMSSSSRRQ